MPAPTPFLCTDCHGSQTVHVTRRGRPDDPEPLVVLDSYVCPRCERTDGAEPCEACGEEPATERLEDGASGTLVCEDCVPEALVVIGLMAPLMEGSRSRAARTAHR